MRYIADLHIHSLYSRATSKASNLQGLAAWAGIKGIQVLGTGDFTHPHWYQHLMEHLVEAEPGFFKLKENPAHLSEGLLPPGISVDQETAEKVRFVLTAEISSIYKRHDRVRKVHNILFAPDFSSAAGINATLSGIGNVESDGRPILGLDSRDLLEIVLEKAPGAFLVPAHIWTPWFSLFGSKSGFEAIEECFGDLSSHVFALETGLSSDPDMNRCISSLDRFSLISNSDCHSPSKLGREANVFNTGFDFFSMAEALRNPPSPERRFEATIEFFPEEGKYHCDGHRKCGVCLEPVETLAHRGKCPECGRPVTVGVLSRVMELADREKPVYPSGAPDVYSLIPLAEVLGELLGAGPATKKVMTAYGQLINRFESEFNLLLQVPITDIETLANPVLGEAVRRIREKRVVRTPGYDGEFGVIRVFEEHERKQFGGQMTLFGVKASPTRKQRTQASPIGTKRKRNNREPLDPAKKELNAKQQKIVESDAGRLIVKAGPGTGKTHTLTTAVVRKIGKSGNTNCTVITFTNRAADEVRNRLETSLGEKIDIFVGTFHGYCLHWLRQWNPDLQVAGPDLRRRLFRTIRPDGTSSELRAMEKEIVLFFSGLDRSELGHADVIDRYQDALHRAGLVDLDEIVGRAVKLLERNDPAAQMMRRRTGPVFVDEFQDLNASQYRLIRLLAESNEIFAIGDPDQAIYRFRGSDPAFFHRFIEELDPEIHTLTRNYRCGSDILNAAQQVIRNNRYRLESEPLEAMRPGRGGIFIFNAKTDKEEAGFVARQIEALLGGTSHLEIDRLADPDAGTASLQDIAVLYRTSRQAGVIANRLDEQGIPFQVVDITPYYMEEPVRELYLLILAGASRAEVTDIQDLLKISSKLGKKDLMFLETLLPLHCREPLSVLSNFRGKETGSLTDSLEQALENLLNRINDFRCRVAEQGIAQTLRDGLANSISGSDNVNMERFFKLSISFGDDLERFADHLLQYRDSVVYDSKAEAVTLMTLHAAKGLEFQVVFIVGTEEGLLPFSPPGELSEEERLEHDEEERRLFFVGMTRASETLYLSGCRTRFIYGKETGQTPSRFLAEIPGELTAEVASIPGDRKKKPKTSYRQLSLF